MVPDPNTFGGKVKINRGNGYEEVPLDKGFYNNSRAIGLSDMADAIENGRFHRANYMQQLHVLEIMTSYEKSSKLNAPCKIESKFERQLAVDPEKIKGNYPNK